MIIFLFGLAGSGKNYVGSILEKYFEYHFIDADRFLTDEMKECVANHKPFEQPMRDRYTQIVINKIKEEHQHSSNLAISKALYKEKNRHDIIQAFPNALLIEIQSDPTLIAERIGTRDHLINESFAQLISKGFEKPTLQHETLINNSDEQAVIQQLSEILKRIR